MSENMKEFLKEVENNAELKARLSALPDEEASKEKVVEIAKEYGFTLTAEDYEVSDGENISDDELEAVAGGNCLAAGVKRTNEGDFCMCVIIGAVDGCGCFVFGVA